MITVFHKSIKQHNFFNIPNKKCFLSTKSAYVTLDHKTSLKSLGYICSNSQKYMVWVKIIDFFFYAKNH